MGFLKLFKGKSPEDFEKKADSLIQDQEYGLAKIEYEKAMAKLEKQPDPNPELKNRIEKKHIQCKEHLAAVHVKNAKELIEANCYEDAQELFQLALELTEDTNLSAEIQETLEEFSDSQPVSEYDDVNELEEHQENRPWEDDEYFTALCSSLPKEEQEAYLGYGVEFKIGYVALNQGDFSTAVQNLSTAMKEHSSTKTFIPLELATAYLNQGDYSESELLLIDFLKDFPKSIKAYQLMCEILWENNNFQAAEKLLQTCPQKISASLPIQLLLGETYFLAKNYQKASDFYQEILKKRKFDSHIAQSLAKTHEALGQNEEARDLYQQIIGACQSCGNRIDPYIKLRYAETSFEIGDFSTKLLELYFNLAQEDPENQSHYYQKISHIYSEQGNEQEAKRYLSFIK